MVAALHKLALVPRHVVAQIIKTELVVRAIRDVGIVLFAALRRLLVGDDASDAHAKEPVDAAHKFALVAGEVVVDGDHMHALAFERIEVARQGCDQGLTFTGLHFRDIAPMQCRTAHELHVKVTHAQCALRSLTYGGERLRHNVVKALAVVKLLLELGGLSFKFLVGEGRYLVLKRIHRFRDVFQLLQLVAFTHA